MTAYHLAFVLTDRSRSPTFCYNLEKRWNGVAHEHGGFVLHDPQMVRT